MSASGFERRRNSILRVSGAAKACVDELASSLAKAERELLTLRALVTSARAASRCNHRIKNQGDRYAYPLLDANGQRVDVSWCRRCGAIKVGEQPWELPAPKVGKGR